MASKIIIDKKTFINLTSLLEINVKINLKTTVDTPLSLTINSEVFSYAIQKLLSIGRLEVTLQANHIKRNPHKMRTGHCYMEIERHALKS